MKKLKASESSLPELVFLDINMPGMNGFEVLFELQNIFAENEKPRVVMLTASDRSQDVEKSEEAGAYGLLTKPCSIDSYVGLFNNL